MVASREEERCFVSDVHHRGDDGVTFRERKRRKKSSIFPPMSAEATAVHPATQITHDDDVNTKLENSDNVFLRRKAKPDAAFEEKKLTRNTHNS